MKLFSKRKYRWEVEQHSYWSFCVNLLIAFFPLLGIWCGNHSFLLNFQCNLAGVNGPPSHPENHVGHISPGLLTGRGRKRSNFAGFLGTNSRKNRPISRKFRGSFRGKLHQKAIGKKRPILWHLRRPRGR